jgi:hypothetical protein
MLALHAAGYGSPASEIAPQTANLTELLAGSKQDFPDISVGSLVVSGDLDADLPRWSRSAALLVMERPHRRMWAHGRSRSPARRVEKQTHCPLFVVPREPAVEGTASFAGLRPGSGARVLIDPAYRRVREVRGWHRCGKPLSQRAGPEHVVHHRPFSAVASGRYGGCSPETPLAEPRRPRRRAPEPRRRMLTAGRQALVRCRRTRVLLRNDGDRQVARSSTARATERIQRVHSRPR